MLYPLCYFLQLFYNRFMPVIGILAITLLILLFLAFGLFSLIKRKNDVLSKFHEETTRIAETLNTSASPKQCHSILQSLKALEQFNRDNPDILALRAKAQALSGDKTSAIATIKRLFIIGDFGTHFTEETAREFLARLYNETEEYSDAFDEYSILIQKYPSNLNYLFNGAVAALEIGNTEVAELLLQRTLSRESKHPRALFLLGQLFYRRSQYEQSAEYFDRITGMDTPELNYYRGAAFLETSRYCNQAASSLERCLSSPNWRQKALLLLPKAYIEAGKHEKAEDQVKICLEEMEGNLKKHQIVNLKREEALSFELRLDYDNANRVWTEIIELDPDAFDIETKIVRISKYLQDKYMRAYLCLPDDDFFKLCLNCCKYKDTFYQQGSNSHFQTIKTSYGCRISQKARSAWDAKEQKYLETPIISHLFARVDQTISKNEINEIVKELKISQPKQKTQFTIFVYSVEAIHELDGIHEHDHVVHCESEQDFIKRLHAIPEKQVPTIQAKLKESSTKKPKEIEEEDDSNEELSELAE